MFTFVLEHLKFRIFTSVSVVIVCNIYNVGKPRVGELRHCRCARTPHNCVCVCDS